MFQIKAPRVSFCEAYIGTPQQTRAGIGRVLNLLGPTEFVFTCV